MNIGLRAFLVIVDSLQKKVNNVFKSLIHCYNYQIS